MLLLVIPSPPAFFSSFHQKLPTEDFQEVVSALASPSLKYRNYIQEMEINVRWGEGGLIT